MSEHATIPDPARLVTVREPARGRLCLDLAEVWRYRELLGLMIWRNTVVKYKQSVLGLGWALVRPVVTMVVFTVIFGRMAKLDSDGVPYPIFAFVALLPWTYFAGALAGTSGSLVGGSGLLHKVYFPRLVLPLATVCTGLVDFALSFLILAGMMIWYHDAIQVGWGIVLLPFFLLMAMASALAFGLWLSGLMVRYRDVQQLVPFLVQTWMFLTPVVYSSAEVAEPWRVVYYLNPMAGVVDGFRWALLGTPAPDGLSLAVSLSVVALVLVSGLYFFRKTERTVADII
ncbi:MAG: ABC transporter permease [Verrucomicrobiota bacterium]